MSTKFIWDREKLIQAIQPRKPIDLMYAMRLTPSQMQTFWNTEPSVERIMAFKENTSLDPMGFLVPAPIKAAKNDPARSTPAFPETQQ